FLNARRFQAELVKFAPGLFVCVSANDRKNRRTQIRRKRRWSCEIILKTFATACDDFWVVQISQSVDQARAQVPGGGRLALFRFPAQRLKRWTQKRSGVALKFFALRTTNKEPIDEIQHIDDLFAFSQFSGSRQLFNQPKIA